MFDSISSVHEGFFKIFKDKLTIEKGTGSLEIPVIYARHSNTDYSKKMMENYPRIVMLDKMPRFSADWRPNDQKSIVGYDKSEDSEVYDLAMVSKDPLELLFDYQVSCFFTKADDRFAFQNYVFANYRAHGGMVLNKEIFDTSTPEEFIGDMVTYTMSANDNERTDGVFEMNLMFTLKPLVHLEPVEILKLVTEFNFKIE